MIAIIDYGMGNTGSIQNMLSRVGADSVVTSDRSVIEEAERLILPGVGAFDRAMEALHARDLIGVLTRKVIERHTPVLGICLGMQLFSKSSEEGQLPGLGWIDAHTTRFAFPDDGVKRRLPHMGWNQVHVKQRNTLLDNSDPDSRYYFVHTYHVRCNDPSNVLGSTEYGGIDFHSALVSNSILGTQFHPEKSHKFGLRILANFVRAGAQITV